MHLLKAADHRRMPWKNGGGETREIAVYPPGAPLEDIAWRISMADVTSDGPFSVFTGIERTLCVLHGAGLRLDMGAHLGTQELTPDSAPYRFPADFPTQATLLDGPVVDLNVMTRQSSHHHQVQRFALQMALMNIQLDATTVVFCEQGALQCLVASGRVNLAIQDALLLTPEDTHQLTIAGTSDARACVIKIHEFPA